MGRIKQMFVKRVAMEIYNAHKDELGTNFEENKKKVNEYADIESNRIRNKIAGYLTKYVKRMQKKEGKDVIIENKSEVQSEQQQTNVSTSNISTSLSDSSDLLNSSNQ